MNQYPLSLPKKLKDWDERAFQIASKRHSKKTLTESQRVMMLSYALAHLTATSIPQSK